MAPTYESLSRFESDWSRLSPEQKTQFLVSIAKFVADLDGGGRFRPGLRVKGVKGAPNIYEMTFAPEGRATFQYGTEIRPGEPHVIWRRIGTHGVFENP